LITKIVHAQDAYSDCAEAVNTVVNGGQSQWIATEGFDDCYHLSRDFIKIELEFVPLWPTSLLD
jgi:hypothetical protein